MVSESDEGGGDFCPQYSLAHLTLLDCSVPELIFIAARAGYDAVSPRLIPMGLPSESGWDPLSDKMVQAAKTALAVTGLEVHDIELARVTDDSQVGAFEPAMALAAELGAATLMTSVWTDRKNDRNYHVDSFSAICALASEYRLKVVLEFPAFSKVSTLEEALAVIESADQPNGGLLIDTLYLWMTKAETGTLRFIPEKWLWSIQIADAAPPIPAERERMLEIARGERLYPGEGTVNFPRIVKELPPVNYSIEIPNLARVKELGSEEHARRALSAAKKCFGSCRSRRS